MNFRTIINIPESSLKISHKSQILLMGSCFAQNMARKLSENKFVVQNPFGVLYNPLSIAEGLNILLEQKTFTEKDLFFDKNQWHSFAYHSSYSADSREECLGKINDEIVQNSEFIRKADFLVLTFGTSFVYRLKSSGEVVANCHKIEANKFVREQCSVEGIVSTYNKLITRLKTINPDLTIVFTVSPIRHWKDGAHQNQISKSILLLAIDELVRLNNCALYFPAYELMLDDLRDYRFYKEDMLHPNDVAIEYIWEAFGNCFFAKETKQINKEVAVLVKNENHRPFQPNSENYAVFLSENKEKTEQFKLKYPFVKL